MNKRLDTLTRKELIQCAHWLADTDDDLIYDTFSNEQLRLIITNKSINYILELILD